MCNRRQFLKMLIIGVAIQSLPCASAWAHSITMSPKLIVDSPSQVLMIDGKDRNSNVKIVARLDVPERCAFDFGFISDGLYTAITGNSKTTGRYVFAGGVAMDFALRNYGADRSFGTPDDMIYRLSDDANYAREIFSKPVKSSKTKKTVLTQEYFRDLRLGWDLDLDGKTDAYSWLEVKRGKYDGMMPVHVPAAVPVPAAMWFFGSGLVGLALVARRAGWANTV